MNLLQEKYTEGGAGAGVNIAKYSRTGAAGTFCAGEVYICEAGDAGAGM